MIVLWLFWKEILWICVVYYGMLRGKKKGRKEEGSMWTGEEQAWRNIGKRG